MSPEGLDVTLPDIPLDRLCSQQLNGNPAGDPVLI